MNLNDVSLGLLVAIVLGAFTSKTMLTWALKNGRSIGKMIAKRIPGDNLEKWMIEFLRGVAEGLESEVEEDEQKAKVATPTGAHITLTKAKLRR